MYVDHIRCWLLPLRWCSGLDRHLCRCLCATLSALLVIFLVSAVFGTKGGLKHSASRRTLQATLSRAQGLTAVRTRFRWSCAHTRVHMPDQCVAGCGSEGTGGNSGFESTKAG